MSYVHFTLDSNKNKNKCSILNVSESTETPSPIISRRHFTSKMISGDTTSNIQNGVRQDAFGNYISKGKKCYKVSFVDNVSNKKLTEVILIERVEEKQITNKANCDCETGCLLI